MKREEKELFKELCKFKSMSFEEKLLQYASPQVLGMLFFNRMQGIAYDRMKRSGVLGKVNREFRNSLKYAYDQNIERNKSFFTCVDYLSGILSTLPCKIAMLKGAYLCAHYPVGYRTSNDIDILVKSNDVTVVSAALISSGFIQGNIRNGAFVPATRKEIIESKMMRGETVPYIKAVNLPYMKYLEVDINFSLDYKNGDQDILADLLDRSTIVYKNGISIPTLSQEDFFIHLCTHLYKEATTLPWIEMKRDMTLYKYCDIYLLLAEMNNSDVNSIFTRAKNIGLEKVCAYTILETLDLFNMRNNEIKEMCIYAVQDDPNFVVEVIAPKEKKKYRYKTANATERFFMDNRIDDLEEVN